MSKKTNIPEKVQQIVKDLGYNPKEVCWDCHGTWVLKHWACERIAAEQNIKYDAPVIIESNASEHTAVILVTGHLGDKTEWSIGEATVYNCKNAYPYAMAEKRAKDRVILKLVDLHGEVYSEEEAQDLKDEIARQEIDLQKKEVVEQKNNELIEKACEYARDIHDCINNDDEDGVSQLLGELNEKDNKSIKSMFWSEALKGDSETKRYIESLSAREFAAEK